MTVYENDLQSPFGCDSEYYQFLPSGPALVYVCNCNGLRRRDVAQSIEEGAERPRDIFASHGCQAQCAKCVCEMRQMIQASRESFALAAE